MDPTEALVRIRHLIVDLSAEIDAGDRDDSDEVAELIETVHGLDAWITKGGFLPHSWEKAQASA